ncbi:cytochrome c biogenesis CcdA family protein [Effusibacillus dendaii]|uniref:Cytochrome C biogenesis protein CcdA n=1 Tax=Effusibacillus dendaii TaxID=2743772 RepID=A0A7I8DDV1_9BACL|nr:cytochrome c biogenesis protein CcdA [Effusibacillus dendaii]BCJ88294.1 cytochrome C biogenesis protein CcdA [Effusibacillus dendaii]
MSTPTIYLAFVAGLLSFVSPCCLPLYPSYISYITGVSFDEMKSAENRKKIRKKALLHSVFFVVGFSIIFMALGMSASAIGQLFVIYKNEVRQVGGILVILMGLFLAGVIKADFLYRQKKWVIRSKPAGYLGSVLVGISFAAGWTPCVGPILASVLVLAATNPSSGMILMFFYALGFGLPFLILAYTLGSLRWILRYSDKISRIGGWLMVAMGILLFTNWISRLTVWLIGLFGGFVGF